MNFKIINCYHFICCYYSRMGLNYDANCFIILVMMILSQILLHTIYRKHINFNVQESIKMVVTSRCNDENCQSSNAQQQMADRRAHAHKITLQITGQPQGTVNSLLLLISFHFMPNFGERPGLWQM